MYKEPAPLQRGSITSISLFEHGKHGEAGKIEVLKELKIRQRIAMVLCIVMWIQPKTSLCFLMMCIVATDYPELDQNILSLLHRTPNINLFGSFH